MKRLTIVLLAAAVFSFAPATSQAAIQFLDINFNSDTIGSAPAVGNMPPVITMPGAIGGYASTTVNPYGDSPPTADSGTILVQTPQKAAVFSSAASNTETGALYMDTGFNINSRQMTLGFDIDVMQAPSTLTGPNSQVMAINGNPLDMAGILFSARVFNSNNGQWAFSVTAVPTSATGGVFALRNATNDELTTFGTYQNNEMHRVTVVADYATGIADAYLDGVLGFGSYPLRGGIDNASTYNELFMYMNGESGGQGNSVAVDNLVGYDYANAPVPEPASLIIWSLLGLTMGGASWWRRRKRAK